MTRYSLQYHLEADSNYMSFFLHVVISDKQCTFVPELPDEFAVSAIDSPHKQGAYSSKYIFKAIILPPKLMF